MKNPALGEIEIRFGGKNEGLAHIILHRIEERPYRTQDGKTLAMEKTKVIREETMEHIQEKENVATSFVLEKLKAAGIEVVTDREEFSRILKEETLLQKMLEGSESPEKIEHQRQLVNGLVVNQEPLGLSEDNIANAFKQLDRSLRFNANFEIQSEKLGEEVSVFPGSTGKHGLGIRHIIEERTKKDNLSLDEITALSSLIVDAVQTGDITRDSENRCEISKNGIIAIVRKDFDDSHKNWILTGFHYGGEDVEKNREATETIQTVIAKYGQSPDYSYFRSQVGAVIASLDLNISQTPIKSSGVSKIADQNNETEVKDGAISVTSLKTETINKKASIRSPNDTYGLLSHIKNEGQEHFGVILLDEAYDVKAINTVSIGTINKSLVHPRDVFSEAIKAKAAAMIVFHNHPSGNPLPSNEDLNTTRTLLKVSEVVGIPILDHVIATKNSYYSFLEQDILDDLKPKAEFLIKNNQIYGFTHNGKIYLDPEIMNSNAAVHEYTHLWDKYIQNTNPELWERGREIFSKTHLWNEVKADPNYADISGDDDLILSEVHSRICGKIAEQVLERIAGEDGEITKDKVIDWDREVWDYLSKEFLTAEDKEILFDERQKDQINEFVSLSLKDLMEEKEISLSQSMEQSRISGIELKSDNPRERVKEITSQLEKGVKDLFESKKYQEYLDVMSKFHGYSVNNIQLIAMQKPSATLVAGFQAWKKDFERTVRKGEKGIKILVPIAYKKKSTEHENKLDEDIVSVGEDLKPDAKEYLTFKIGHVFDVSQTEGKDLPSIGVDELSGVVEQYSEIYSALEKLSPYSVYFEDINSGAKGYCDFSGKKIAVKNGMSEAQTIKTLVHEISHAKLHENGVADKRTAEVQAESVAYTVCKHFGLDTSDYSFAYVTGWSSGKDTKELKESLDLIRKTSVEFIESIEKTISETISQKKSREENMENENSTTVPDLRTHNRLKEGDIRNLEVITDEDFSDIIDSMLLNDYRHIPNVIRLPNIRGDLAEKLGLEKDAAFIMKNGISHIRPARKGAYEQAFDDEEYRSIPKIIREATFAVIDKRYNNFQFVFDDEENEKMINKIVFNKDKLGNYLVTVGKVNRRDSFSEAINEVVGVGVAPTISALRGEPPATRLRPSPTTENSIAQEYKSVNEKENRAVETPDILKEPKVEINGEMTENLSLFKDNRWIDGREMPVEIIASAIDYISEKTEYSASNSDDIDSIPEEIRKDAISVALKNHIKDGKYSYLLDFKNNLRQEAFAGEVNRLSSNFKDTAKLMFETLNEEFSMEKITQEENMENEGKANETIEKKLENKGARENRRAVADLDLEYQSKASKIADLDLEYPYKNRFSKKEFSGAWVPFNNAKTIKEEMEYNEKLVPFLPNEKGEINARPIYNANTGDCLVLKDLLPMQVKMDTVMSLEKDGEIKIGDFYTPIAATKKSIDAAHTSIKTGERGVFYNFKRKDGTIGTSQYFFPEQTESPDKVIQSAQKKILERHKEIGGENNSASRPPITITSSEPKEYLGKYYAAMITNSALKCSPEIGREFKEKFNAVLENQLADKKDFNPKIGTLHNLFFEAGKVSSDIIKQMKREDARPQAQQKELKRNEKAEMSR